jgi:hypothetical protein
LQGHRTVDHSSSREVRELQLRVEDRAEARVFSSYVFRRIGQRLDRILLERLTEPIHLNIASIIVAFLGSFRAKVRHDLIVRQQFAFSILDVADRAVKHGIKKLTLIEFGVANGAGLLNMCRVAASVTKETGVEFEIFGFDTGTGLPPPFDYRDHPEHWRTNDFTMEVSRLEVSLPTFAHIIIGDIAQTVPKFLGTLTPSAPLAFASLDVDYYSSSKAALSIFSGHSDLYLPTCLLYVANIIFDNVNPWCGELLAIDEFNDEQRLRKVSPYRFLRHFRVFKNARWIDQIYVVNIFDHPARHVAGKRNVYVTSNEYLP